MEIPAEFANIYPPRNQQQEEFVGMMRSYFAFQTKSVRQEMGMIGSRADFFRQLRYWEAGIEQQTCSQWVPVSAQAVQRLNVDLIQNDGANIFVPNTGVIRTRLHRVTLWDYWLNKFLANEPMFGVARYGQTRVPWPTGELPPGYLAELSAELAKYQRVAQGQSVALADDWEMHEVIFLMLTLWDYDLTAHNDTVLAYYMTHQYEDFRGQHVVYETGVQMAIDAIEETYNTPMWLRNEWANKRGMFFEKIAKQYPNGFFEAHKCGTHRNVEPKYVPQKRQKK